MPATRLSVELLAHTPDALALIYELCAAADPDPAVLLEFAGVPLAALLARLTADPARTAPAPAPPLEKTLAPDAVGW